MEGVNLTKYIVSTYVNITMYPLYNYYVLIILIKKNFIFINGDFTKV
jgi:hypothetical protein